MKIKIHTDEHKFTIPIPNALFMNNLVINIASKAISESSGMNFSKEHLKLLFKEIKRAKKLLNGVPLIHVKTNNGEEVNITL